MNSVSQKQINNWKSVYKEIFSIVLNGQQYIYRNLNVGECQQLQIIINKQDPKLVEDFILYRCILCPKNFNPDDESSILCTTLSDNVLKSAKLFFLDGLDELLKKSKADLAKLSKDDFFVWKTNIMQVFPGYTFETLEQLTPAAFFRLVYLCEELTGKRLIGPVGKKKSPKNADNKDVQHIPNENIHDKKVKMRSDSELNQISIDNSVKALQDHYRKIKGK